MTQDEIYEMVRQSDLGFLLGDNWMMQHEFEAFAKLVAAKEQEDIIQIIKETLFDDCFHADVIDAIRSRGEQA